MARATPKDFTLKAGILHLKHPSRERVTDGIVIKVKKNQRTEEFFGEKDELVITTHIIENKTEYHLPDWMLTDDVEEILLTPYKIDYTV